MILPCDVSGRPKPKFKWVRRGGNFDLQSDRFKVSLYDACFPNLFVLFFDLSLLQCALDTARDWRQTSGINHDQRLTPDLWYQSRPEMGARPLVSVPTRDGQYRSYLSILKIVFRN